MAEIEVTVKRLRLECSRCGEPLDGDASGIILHIRPCECCLGAAREVAREEAMYRNE